MLADLLSLFFGTGRPRRSLVDDVLAEHDDVMRMIEGLSPVPSILTAQQQERDRIKAEIDTFLTEGFQKCNDHFKNLVPSQPAALARLRQELHQMKRELLITAVALYDRDAVESWLHRRHRQSLLYDYSIGYAEHTMAPPSRGSRKQPEHNSDDTKRQLEQIIERGQRAHARLQKKQG